MKTLFTGLQDMDFLLNGDRIDGVKLHFLAVDPAVEGKAAFNQFIKRHVFNSFDISLADMRDFIGAEVDIQFNPKGKIVGFAV